MNLLTRLLGISSHPEEGASPAPSDLQAELDASRHTCAELRERLDESETHLSERTELLYNLQRQYASEHLDNVEALRNLKTERMRSAGATADREVMMTRFAQMQRRIASLLEHLRKYEACEDEWIDSSPIVRTDK